ncbi:hypothetical protein ABK040_010518 [Willaertia magna]
MKAAVLHQYGQVPKFESSFEKPSLPSHNAVKNLDKAIALGKHTIKYPSLPAIVGMDGIGTIVLQNNLENNENHNTNELNFENQRVYAIGSGMLGQFAFVEKNKTIPIPDNLDDISAAALPNAVMGSALALMDRGNLKKGQIVLINGATGVTGKVAVQLAKLYGASKVIVTGRNKEQLDLLLELGADKIISLLGTDEEIINELEQVYKETPIDLIIDYLWGHPIELIIQSLKSLVNHNTIINPIRIVTVGSMAGDTTNIPSLVLRSLPLEIVGSGFGSFSREGFRDLFVKYLPEAFEYAAQGKLKIDTEVHNLEDIENVWNKKVDAGKRLVIKVD